MYSVPAGFIYSKYRTVTRVSTLYQKFQDDRLISVDRIMTLSVVCPSVRCHCLYECVLLTHRPSSICDQLSFLSVISHEQPGYPRLLQSIHADQGLDYGIIRENISSCIVVRWKTFDKVKAEWHLKGYEKVLWASGGSTYGGTCNPSIYLKAWQLRKWFASYSNNKTAEICNNQTWLLVHAIEKDTCKHFLIWSYYRQCQPLHQCWKSNTDYGFVRFRHKNNVKTVLGWLYYFVKVNGRFMVKINVDWML